jgi:monoamine oxidase
MSDPFTVTRRDFLNRIAKVGGAGAALATLHAMGGISLAIGAEHHYAGPPKLPGGIGKGKKVAIIGAGIAGLVAAHELTKAGFTCVVLEARTRPGGRNWTVRGGDRIEQTDGVQNALWPKAPHLYMNVGPARLPNHHLAVLGYCREFKVPLEIMMNDNRAARFQDDAAFDGKPVEARQVINDTRGYMSELLAKAMIGMIRSFGDLRGEGKYAGSERSGYTIPPGAANVSGTIRPPLPLPELLKADFWQFKMSFGEGFEQASTMLQPIGGMDQIPKAIAKHLGRMIRYNTSVDEIRKTANGAKVVCHTGNGPRTTIESDFVICTLPLSVLKSVPNDLAPATQRAIADIGYARPSKIGFYAPRRFWEEDDGIYGGMSWTNREITQMLYPSHGIMQKDGVLVGQYSFGFTPEDDVSRLSVRQRLDNAIASGERIHRGYGKMVKNGVSVAWINVPHNLGGWMQWSEEQRKNIYPLLLEPDGPIHLAGEHLSYLTGWQEGAILSAHRAIEQIAARMRA